MKIIFIVLSCMLFSCELREAPRPRPVVPPICSKITEIGQCTPGDWSVYAECAVKLKTGKVLQLRAPVMVDQVVCKKANSSYWYFD